VLITGIPSAPEGKRAVLSAQGAGKGGVVAEGKLRFEHLTISGSAGRGLTADSGEVTLGAGARVTGNEDGGVKVGSNAAFILDGGTIENNKSSGIGAGVFVMGAFTMKQGAIRNNTGTGQNYSGAALSVFINSSGGGVYIASDKPASIEGGDISGNKAGVGAGIAVAKGTLTLSGGSVSGNTATGDGGGAHVREGTLIQSGGSISGNTATNQGGGVFVLKGGTFTRNGGSVSGNKAREGADIHRVQ
jgi:hypothetical protein